MTCYAFGHKHSYPHFCTVFVSTIIISSIILKLLIFCPVAIVLINGYFIITHLLLPAGLMTLPKARSCLLIVFLLLCP